MGNLTAVAKVDQKQEMFFTQNVFYVNTFL
jgi:hypothetical protein